jgi:hypothetical protein
MRLSVGRDLVPSVSNLRYQLGMTIGHVSEDEERRSYGGVVEEREQVVRGRRDPVLVATLPRGGDFEALIPVLEVHRHRVNYFPRINGGE